MADGFEGDDDDDTPALVRVRAIAGDAGPRVAKAAKRGWPPVEPGGSFVLFVDDLSLDEYVQSTCEVINDARRGGRRYRVHGG